MLITLAKWYSRLYSY